MRMWREGEVLNAIWCTNGILYSEAVFLNSPVNVAAVDQPASPLPGGVLFVQIKGENTNTHYAEAFAELAFELGKVRQPLELKDGLVWCPDYETRRPVACLEIPGSGVKCSRGETLRFSGNMPPSERGSLVLKISLDHMGDKHATELLLDLDFAEELRELEKQPKQPGTNSARRQLLFSSEVKDSGF